MPSEIVTDGNRSDLEDFATELYEWFSLVRLGSPRVAANDDIDSYLSRYRVPSDAGPTTQSKVGKVTWQGFFSADWVRELLVDVLATLPSRTWFSLSATSFAKGMKGDSSEVAFLRPPDSAGQYLLWEVKGEDS